MRKNIKLAAQRGAITEEQAKSQLKALQEKRQAAAVEEQRINALLQTYNYRRATLSDKAYNEKNLDASNTNLAMYEKKIVELGGKF